MEESRSGNRILNHYSYSVLYNAWDRISFWVLCGSGDKFREKKHPSPRDDGGNIWNRIRAGYIHSMGQAYRERNLEFSISAMGNDWLLPHSRGGNRWCAVLAGQPQDGIPDDGVCLFGRWIAGVVCGITAGFCAIQAHSALGSDDGAIRRVCGLDGNVAFIYPERQINAMTGAPNPKTPSAIGDDFSGGQIAREHARQRVISGRPSGGCVTKTARDWRCARGDSSFPPPCRFPRCRTSPRWAGLPLSFRG